MAYAHGTAGITCNRDLNWRVRGNGGGPAFEVLDLSAIMTASVATCGPILVMG